MKIVLPNLPFPYVQGLASALKTLEDSCDLQVFLWNLEKPLMDVLDELRPDIILLYQQHIDVTLEIAAQDLDFNYIALTGTPVQIKKLPIAYITDNNYIGQFINYQKQTLISQPSANVAQIHNGQHSDKLDSEVCVFNNNVQLSAEHIKILEWLAANYHTKILGPQKIDLPQYLGNFTIFERADAIASSKVCIDLGNFDMLDASYLKRAPVVLNGTNDLYKNFKSIGQLEEILNNLISNKQDRKKYCNTVYEDILKNKTFYHRVAEIFTIIKDQKRSEKSLNKLKELVS
tara:strand:+ start:6523 stop:7389 length:867 start_codon:yes stop_codon:yes gene_type:complete